MWRPPRTSSPIRSSIPTVRFLSSNSARRRQRLWKRSTLENRRLSDDWTVWRQDDNGNHFAVQTSLTYGQAKSLAKALEEKGHKQFYWYQPTRAGSRAARPGT